MISLVSHRRQIPILFAMLLAMSCGRGSGLSVEIFVGDPGQIGPQDPPYLPQVVFPSGMRLDLVPAAELTVTYPTPAGNPFGSGFTGHYERVGFFIDLDRAPVGERISENFRLSEFVAPTLERGGRLAYVDAQMAQHVQTIRSGLGRPLILTSAFRSPIHNQSAGGATFSRHIYGDAVDIDVDQSRSDAEVRAQEIFNEALDAGVDFVLPLSETSVTVNGVSRVSWVHLDDRGF